MSFGEKDTVSGGLEQELDTLTESLKSRISDILFGEEDGEALEATLLKSFKQRGMTLATAESFTGGRIASQLTSVPGELFLFKGSIVSYATDVKSGVLHVPEDLIRDSVVSEQVACAMAEQVRSLLQADIGVATTGNAGPDKGDSDSPVGRVFIGISSPESTYAMEFTMGNHPGAYCPEIRSQGHGIAAAGNPKILKKKFGGTIKML